MTSLLSFTKGTSRMGKRWGQWQSDKSCRIIEQCRVKCIPTHYHEPDLNKGEMVCIDRCVFKYGEIQRLLAKKMEEKDKEPVAFNSSSSSFASTPSNNDMPSTL